MRVLVTGGAGFIGSHLATALVTSGHEVRVLDNLATGHEKNLAAIRGDVDFVKGDIRDLDTCRAACAGIERVWHLAALGSVPRSVADPILSHESNATGTLNMLVAARDAGARRFVFASSSSVYGANPQLPREESQHPMPVSPYANTKLAAETYVRQFASLYDLETVALRYFNVYGPRQDPKSVYAAVVPRFVSALLAGEAPVIYGDGEQSREFTFVADCVQGNLLAGLNEPEGITGEHFNIATGRPVTVNALLAAIQDELDIHIPAHYEPSRAGDVRFSDSIIEKARTRLGYDPKWSVQDGVRETCGWYVGE